MKDTRKTQQPFDVPWILALLAVLLIAYLQHVYWLAAHAENMADLIRAYEGVLDGTPHWRAYQNRLLSPYLVDALGWVSNDPYALFAQLSLALLNVGLFVMTHQVARSALVGVLVVLTSALLWTLQTHYWSYPWDFTEAGFLLALAWLAVSGKSLRWFLGLFVIALLNRESAVYLAVYLVVCGAAMQVFKQGAGKSLMVWGVGLGVAAMVWTEGVRSLLFDYSSLVGVQADLAHSTFGNHFHLKRNLQMAKQMLLGAPPLLFMLMIYACALLMVLVRGIAARHAPGVAMAVALAVYLASLPVFGLLHEQRIYQPFNWSLPFMLVYALVALRSDEEVRGHP